MRKQTVLAALVLILRILTAAPASAQDTSELLKMDIEDILGMDVTVFSVRGLTQRQTPGVLTVIDEKEIRRSGARDLTDVLRLVPGFELGVDVQSAVGLGIRGLWAQEGKVLLMLDGMEMNEILYSCLALGDHFPVEHLRRVEISRGPGTSYYGGYAELAVINLITKGAADLRGFEASASYGRTADAEGRRSLSLNFGRKFGGLKVKALSYFSRSLRSDADYSDIYGNRYSMKDASAVRPAHINLGAQIRGFDAQVVFDRYLFDSQDALGEILERPFDNAFHSYAGRMRYETGIGRGVTWTVTGSYLRQEPWKTVDPSALAYDWYFYLVAERVKASIQFKGAFRDDLQWITGAEIFQDLGSVAGKMPEELFFSDGRRHIANRQGAAFAQVYYTRGNTIPSIGLRFETIEHGREKTAGSGGNPSFAWSSKGSEWMPWLGVTRILGKWSLKGLLGQTFRAPAVLNFDLNPDIRPEKTTTGELEIGYQAGDNWFFIMDLFRTRIKGPIVYFYNPVTDEESYGNYRRVGSQGLEIESRWKSDRGYWNASYSFYRPTETIDSYRVPGHPGAFLGLACHKAAFSASRQWGRGFSVNPSLVLYGTRYGFASADAEGHYSVSRFKPSLLANLCLQADRVCGTPVDASLAVYNALDADVPFIQPYDGGHAPLPSQSREFILSLRTRLQW